MLLPALALGLPFGLAVFPVHAFRCASCRRHQRWDGSAAGQRLGGCMWVGQVLGWDGTDTHSALRLAWHTMSFFASPRAALTLACRYWRHVRAVRQAGELGAAADQVVPYSLNSALSDNACTVVSRLAEGGGMRCGLRLLCLSAGTVKQEPSSCRALHAQLLARSHPSPVTVIMGLHSAHPLCFAGQGRCARGGCPADCAAWAARH